MRLCLNAGISSTGITETILSQRSILKIKNLDYLNFK